MENILPLLAHASTRRRVPKRFILLRQGEIPRQVYFLRKGCVKVYRIGNDGEEQVAGFKTAGDVFPECWVFGYTACTMYYYETVETSDIVTVEKNEFLRLIQNEPAIATAIFDYMVKNYTSLMIQVSALEQSRATDKLLMILYYLMIRHGVEKKHDEFWLNMRIRHATLASLTGLARETVTIEMGRLRRKRVVDYDLRKFVIHKQALKDMIDDDSFSSIHL